MKRISAFAGFITTLFAAGAAHADTLGSVFCRVSMNIMPFGGLINALAYIAGGVLTGAGLIHLQKNADRESASPLVRGISYTVGGAGLLAFPSFAHLLTNSLYVNQSVSGLSACVSGGSATAAQGLDGAMVNFVSNLQQPLIFLASVVCFLGGVWMVWRGLLKGARAGKPDGGHSTTAIVANLVIGAIMIACGESMNTILTSIFGSADIAASSSLIAYAADQTGDAQQQVQSVTDACLHFLQVVGLLAFVRGWFVMRAAVENSGQKTVPQALTHIIAGTLLFNIYSLIDVVGSTLGLI